MTRFVLYSLGVYGGFFSFCDDQVGAAVSMVYSTGIPVMFVGVGQHYQDLKKLNVGVVVKALMK